MINLMEGAIEAILAARMTCADDMGTLYSYLNGRILFAGDINQVFRIANNRWTKIRRQIINKNK